MTGLKRTNNTMIHPFSAIAASTALNFGYFSTDFSTQLRIIVRPNKNAAVKPKSMLFRWISSERNETFSPIVAPIHTGIIPQNLNMKPEPEEEFY